MPGDLTPSEIRGRSFASGRRGYDRTEVDAFLQQVADEFAALQTRMGGITERLAQLGITELPDARAEFDQVSADIAKLLDAARSAAQGLRERARRDAADVTTAATRDAEALRSDAWEAGTELLQQSAAAAERHVAAAKEDALFIRAEAEQDALRLVTDAKRQAEEMVRSARQDAERARVDAHAESTAILEEARRAAEKAQERTRALESRRSELLDELEQARSEIGRAGSERSSQRRPAGEPAVRVITAPEHGSPHWPDDEGAVRIVPAVRSDSQEEVVDAEAMAAEVEQLRAAVLPQRPAEPVEEAPTGEPDRRDEGPVSGEPPVPERDEAPSSEETLPEPAATEPEPIAEPAEKEPGPAPEPEPQPVPVEATAPAEVPAAVEPGLPGTKPDEPAPPTSDLDSLFARLRQAPVEPEPSPQPIPPEPTADTAPEPEPEPSPAAAGPNRFEQRDRLLLPIENRALRGLKRSIVELQNRVLDELRTSGNDWRLGRELVAETLGSELDAMIQEAFLAGHTAAAEELGHQASEVTGGPTQGASEAFTADLHRAVQEVLGRARDDAGSRRLAADIGRVFRAWRTDDAERHVRLAARHAFHDGLLSAYHRFGVAEVALIAPGRPCGECGAGSDIRWDPGEVPPDGVVIPPAGRSCDAIVAPVLADGPDNVPNQ
jgi:DivIVA domain-containing protein